MTNYDDFIPELTSNDYTIVTTCLYKLCGIHEEEPQGQVRKLIISSLSHPEEEVREIAVKVAGIHWKLEEAYPIMMKMIYDKNEHEDVLDMIAAALPCFLRKGIGSFTDVNKALLNLVKNDNNSDLLKKQAYTSLLLIHEFIDINEYAKTGINLKNVAIDAELLADFEKQV